MPKMLPGVYHLFDGVYDIKAAGYTPKPHRATYDAFLHRHGVNAKRAVMFDDISQNLEAPRALGMTTVLICSDAAWLADEPHDKRPTAVGEKKANHVDYMTDNLTAFLNGAVTETITPDTTS